MLISIAADVSLPVLFTNPTTFVSQDADSLPVFRTFSGDGPVAGGNGTAAYLSSGSISAISTGATTTITSATHGLTTGSVITIAGAAGTTNVNGQHTVTLIDANTFSFNDITTSGTYTSGGSWHVPGLYRITLDSTIRASLEAGRSYLTIVYGSFSSVIRAVEIRYTVTS